ncbi:uncharacterized protein LOC130981201 [Arachis stenosperma]|uniref:uncharacterized protein LOC130981201 n=1 Tax=Arachis stenosperma TaxID=217475 RepID=UPI0025ACDF5D|nr:uncharacterized protein LOC130981201 [Arachis stenosperma]
MPSLKLSLYNYLEFTIVNVLPCLHYSSIGNYYLVDAGYTNGPGFLAPYRGTRYHVREWAQGACAPRNYQEYFNRVHSSARNIIERCFGLLKKRWSILRSLSFYPLKTQSQIIIACCLLQNFIRKSMEMDPKEEGSILDEFMPDGDEEQDGMIDVVENTNEWTHWRDNIATEMYEEWPCKSYGVVRVV